MPFAAQVLPSTWSIRAVSAAASAEGLAASAAWAAAGTNTAAQPISQSAIRFMMISSLGPIGADRPGSCQLVFGRKRHHRFLIRHFPQADGVVGALAVLAFAGIGAAAA